MALAQMMKNTDKKFPCVQCGSNNTSIIREDAANPRLKCNQCSFMFDGKDSQDASRAGAIKPSSEESLAEAVEPEKEIIVDTLKGSPTYTDSLPISAEIGTYDLPKNPSYVFLAKNKTAYQFCSKRDFKKVAVQWSQVGSFDVYELSKIKLNVKVDIL